MGRSWKIGAVEIHQVVEIVAPTPLGMLFPDASPERLEPLSDWLRPYFLDDQGNMILSIHAFAIRSGDARIIVDTCLGNGKTRPIPDWSDLETTFLSDLEAAGFPPASVDRVLCTHLHFDHVGWNTVRRDGKWVPTFPNARYLVGEREWAHWEEEDDPFAPQAKQDSILPIFDAGLVDLVQPDHRVNEEIELIPPALAPGLDRRRRRGRRSGASHADRVLPAFRRSPSTHPRHPLRAAHRRPDRQRRRPLALRGVKTAPPSRSAWSHESGRRVRQAEGRNTEVASRQVDDLGPHRTPHVDARRIRIKQTSRQPEPLLLVQVDDRDDVGKVLQVARHCGMANHDEALDAPAARDQLEPGGSAASRAALERGLVPAPAVRTPTQTQLAGGGRRPEARRVGVGYGLRRRLQVHQASLE